MNQNDKKYQELLLEAQRIGLSKSDEYVVKVGTAKAGPKKNVVVKIKGYIFMENTPHVILDDGQAVKFEDFRKKFERKS